MEDRTLPSGGALDPTFGIGGIVTTDFGAGESSEAVAIQPDGKIVVAGNRDGTVFLTARYNTNGSLDTSFASGGVVTTDFPGTTNDQVHALAIQADGKIVVVGYSGSGFPTSNFGVVRYNPNGSLDTTFGSGGIVSTDFASSHDVPFAVAIQADGKIVVGGLTSYGSPTFGLVRYLSNGSLDSTFGSGGKVSTLFSGANSQAIFGITIQGDGKIVAVGYMDHSYFGLQDFAIARYNPNGSLDGTFGTGGTLLTDFGGATEAADSVLVQPDGKIVVAGISNGGSKPDNFAITRYAPSGVLDATFGTGGKVLIDFLDATGGGYGMVRVASQPDGKLVLVGSASNGKNHDFALARLTPNGTLDSTFGTSGKVLTPILSGDDYSLGVAVQPDGKTVAAGYAHNGTNNDFALARYYDSGTLPPGIPTGLSATALGPETIQVSWNATSGAATYKLERATSSNGPWTQIYFASGTSYTDSGTHLSPNTTYYYRVRASNAGGDSPYAGPVSVTTSPTKDIAVLTAAFTAVRQDAQAAQLTYQVTGGLGTFEVGLYRSADQNFGPDDVQVGNLQLVSPGSGSGQQTTTISTGALPFDLARPYVLAVTDPGNKIQEADETNNTYAIVYCPRIVNILTHGWNPEGNWDPAAFNPLDPAWTAFRSDWAALGYKLEHMPAPGSTYDGFVESYVSRWDSSSGFSQAFYALAGEKVADALRAGLNQGGQASTAVALGVAETALKVIAALEAKVSLTLAYQAANQIANDILQNYLLRDQAACNALQRIQLIGHSRGAAVNAEVSRILDRAGYRNIIQFTALDGFSTDWPEGAGDIGDIPITGAVANAPGGRKVNYRVDEGIGGVVAGIAADKMWQFVTGSPSAPMPQLVRNVVDAVLGTIRAPSRPGFDNICLVKPGNDGPTNHINITERYLESNSYPGKTSSSPSYQFIYDNFLGWNRFAGLPPSQDQAEKQGDFFSQDCSPTVPWSFLISAATGFAGGSFEALGDLFANIVGANLGSVGDPFVDAWISYLGNSTRILESLWRTEGLVQLIANNSSAQLTQTSVAPSIGQYVTLPAAPGPLSFKVTVVQAGPGDKLQVLQDGQVVGEVGLTDSGATGTHSVTLPGPGGRSVNLAFRVTGPGTDPAVIKLDDLTVGGQSNVAPVAFDAEYRTGAGQAISAPVSGLLASAFDVDGDPLTAALAAGPSKGTLTFNPTGQFTYTPATGFSGTDLFTYTVSDGRGGTTTATVRIVVAPTSLPTVAGVQVNNGTAQRSVVRSLTVTFSVPVSFPNGVGAAFQLIRTGPGGPTGAVNLYAVPSGNSVTLTFSSGGAVGLDPGGSLMDGVYLLVVGATQVRGFSGFLDGDGDGVPGGDYTFRFHRLFGDTNGDKRVDALDLFAFAGSFGKKRGEAGYLDYLDSNNDGVVDALDLFAFAGNFGKTLP